MRLFQAPLRSEPSRILAGALLALLLARASQAQACDAHWSPEFSNASAVRRFATLDLGDGPELYVFGPARYPSDGTGYGTSSGIAKWNGGQWVEVAPGLMPPVGGGSVDVYALAALDDGNGLALWAAGRFSTPEFAGEFIVARWDGSAWTALPESFYSPTSYVLDIAYADGSVVVAGVLFFQGGGGGLTARWNGSAWVAMPLEGDFVFAPFAGQDLHVHDGQLYLASDDGYAGRPRATSCAGTASTAPPSAAASMPGLRSSPSRERRTGSESGARFGHRAAARGARRRSC
jgi:hypothetical protein